MSCYIQPLTQEYTFVSSSARSGLFYIYSVSANKNGQDTLCIKQRVQDLPCRSLNIFRKIYKTNARAITVYHLYFSLSLFYSLFISLIFFYFYLSLSLFFLWCRSFMESLSFLILVFFTSLAKYVRSIENFLSYIFSVQISYLLERRKNI